MTSADTIYESINKDWFYYEEEHDKVYYQQQKLLCDEFINESRREQTQLISEIEELNRLLQQKQERYQQLQMKKELIKDRAARLNDELHPSGAEKRRPPF